MVNNVVLVPLLLTFNRFNKLFCCFIDNFEQVIAKYKTIRKIKQPQ